MKNIITFVLGAILAFPALIAAQTTVTARVGTDSEAYHFAEVVQQLDNDTLIGAGYLGTDTPDANREAWAGIGRAFNVAGVNILAIGFVDQTGGDATDAQTSIQPWLLATRNFGKVVGTANYLIYTPVGDGEVIQVLEHAKSEYRISGSWLAGAGYAAVKVGDAEWQHKPFLTTTLLTKLGSFEVWAQRPREGASSFQLRYQRNF